VHDAAGDAQVWGESGTAARTPLTTELLEAVRGIDDRLVGVAAAIRPHTLGRAVDEAFESDHVRRLDHAYDRSGGLAATHTPAGVRNPQVPASPKLAFAQLRRGIRRVRVVRIDVGKLCLQ